NAICPVAGTRMTINDEVRRAREVRKQQGIQREDRGVAQIEELDPDDIAPMVVYLASEHAGAINGQFFLCFGNQVSLVAQPRAGAAGARLPGAAAGEAALEGGGGRDPRRAGRARPPPPAGGARDPGPAE